MALPSDAIPDAFLPYTVTSNDLVYPATLAAAGDATLVFTTSEQAGSPPGFVLRADGTRAPFSLPSGAEAVWPLSAGGAVVHAGSALFTVRVGDGGEAEVAEFAALPAESELVAVSAEVGGDGLPLCVLAFADDKEKPGEGAPIVLPAPPAVWTAHRWTATTKAFAAVGDVPGTSDDLAVSADGSLAVWRVYLNPIPEEAERGEYWCMDAAGKVSQVTEGAGRTYRSLVTPDNANFIYQANYEAVRPITTHMTLFIRATDGSGRGFPLTIDGLTPGGDISGMGWVAGDDRQLLFVTTIVGNDSETHVVDVPAGAAGGALHLSPVVTLADQCCSKNVILAPPSGGGDAVFWYGCESLTDYPSIRAGTATIPIEQPSMFDNHRSRIVKWTATDGTPLQGAVFELDGTPPDASLMVNAHGGPAVAFCIRRADAAGSLRYPMRHWLAAGYRVFQPFFRGTLAFGDEFAAANIGRQGDIDYDDMMTGIAALAAEGLTFGDRKGIFGGSYGGYMTNVAATRNDFKVGISQYGFVHNRFMSLEGGDFTWEDEYMPPGHASWPVTDATTRSDVFQHMGDCRTPLLILHGEKDDICTVSQSYIMYRALKSQGVPTMLRIYPGEKHGFKEHRYREDRDVESLRWVLHYLPATP